jgi:hypothetical protein
LREGALATVFLGPVLSAAGCEVPEDIYPIHTGPDGPDPTDTDTGLTDTGGDTDTGDPIDTDTDVVSVPVTVKFDGSVVTVSGSPFGLLPADVLDTPVTGSFTYDLGVADTLWSNAFYSLYDHEGWSAPFVLDVGGRTITGSGMPVVTIELFSHTFRWVDGPQILDESEFRVCSVDGVMDPSIQIDLSITPETFEPFPDDDLPAEFPFVGLDLYGTSITFSVIDSAGTLLMQLDSFTDIGG